MHVLLHFSPPSRMRMPSPSLLSSNRERVPRAPPQQLPRNTFPSARTRVLTRNGFAEIRGRVVLLCVPVPRLAHSAARNRTQEIQTHRKICEEGLAGKSGSAIGYW